MFVFHLKKFAGNLSIQDNAADNIPSDSPIILYYSEDGNYTKHEIFRRFNNILKSIDWHWIRPLDNLTGEWVIDLKQLKQTFERLKDTNYLKSKLTLEAEYLQDKRFDATGKEQVISTSIKFYIDSAYITSSQFNHIEIDNDLIDPIKRFKKDYADSSKCCFLMMKFEDSGLQTNIVKVLKEEFQKRGLYLLRADDKEYADDLFANIKTYMHCCSFGISLFERINSNYFNPNVSLEVGYMMALKKPILFLKDRTLQSLHTDLVGKLYYEFDFQNIENTIPNILDKWLKNKEII